MKKVLIIDDKSITELQSSLSLVKNLDNTSKKLVDLNQNIGEYWKFENQNQDRIKLKNESLNNYSFVFIHQSYDHSLLNNLELLLDSLPNHLKLVLFSGQRSESLKSTDNPNFESEKYMFPQKENGNRHYEIRRSVYFRNFSDFIQSSLLEGNYNIEHLYLGKLKVDKNKLIELLKKIQEKLELSNKAAIDSAELKNFYTILGYNIEQLILIKQNLISKEYNEIIEILEDEISKYKT